MEKAKEPIEIVLSQTYILQCIAYTTANKSIFTGFAEKDKSQERAHTRGLRKKELVINQS